VKPANIVLTHLDDEGGQRVPLTDFGIARNADDTSGLTAANMTVGTVAYRAPGQLLGEEEVDGREYQYSLAANAFHLLIVSPITSLRHSHVHKFRRHIKQLSIGQLRTMTRPGDHLDLDISCHRGPVTVTKNRLGEVWDAHRARRLGLSAITIA
jgi:serine/threonine protein kinase